MKPIEFINQDKYKKLTKMLLCVVSVTLCAINTLLIFNNNFWCDEIASIMISEMPIGELISTTAMDVHPPLYHLILKIICLIFGFTGPVFHAVSLVPYVIILVLSLTLIWKKLNPIVSVVLIVLSSLLYCSMHFNVEVRMYSWASLFILLSFCYFREILAENKVESYILFALFSLLAAYTHYFCIITVACLYVSIMIFSIRNKGNRIKRTIITWILTVILYLPWAISFIGHYSKVTDKIYSATYNSIGACLEYIFNSKFSWGLLAFFLIIAVVTIIKYASSAEKTWIITGILAVFFTILVPYIISIIMSPIMEKRHVYPSFIIAWVLLGYCISKCRYKWAYLLTIALLIVVPGVKALRLAYTEENGASNAVEEFLDKTFELDAASDIVISNEWQICYALIPYYYSEDIRVWQSEDEADIISYINNSAQENVWLFITDDIVNGFQNRLKNQGISTTTVIENGYLVSIRIWVYRTI